MFKSNKKKKLQENENIEKNENIAKNRTDAENLEGASEKPEIVIPSASDILEVSKQKWKETTAEEVVKVIQKESSNGCRYVRVFERVISDELVKELKEKGYRVNVYPSPSSTGPYFEIYW